MHSLQIHLFNLDVVWHLTWVRKVVEMRQELMEIDVPRGVTLVVPQELLIQVLKPNHDLISSQRQYRVALLWLEVESILILWWRRQDRRKRLPLLLLLFVVKTEEVDGRLLTADLLYSLQRLAFLVVEDLHVVLCVGLNAKTVSVGLVERFRQALVVTVEETASLNKLNVRQGSQVSSACLWPIVHYRHLDVALVALVHHRDGGVDWEEARRYGLVIWSRRVVDWRVARLDLLNLSLEHSKCVGVSVELSFWIKAVKNLPIHGDFLAMPVIDIDRVEKHFELHDFAPEFGREANIDDATFVLLLILEVYGPLFDKAALLIANVFLNNTKIDG